MDCLGTCVLPVDLALCPKGGTQPNLQFRSFQALAGDRRGFSASRVQPLGSCSKSATSQSQTETLHSLVILAFPFSVNQRAVTSNHGTGNSMITARTLILGSAAGLIAISGAQAADLPVKAKAVEYVRICSLVRRRFYLHPGHRYLHQDRRLSARGHSRLMVAALTARPPGTAISASRTATAITSSGRSRMALTIDTRTATEYGVVRTYGQGDFQFQTSAHESLGSYRFRCQFGFAFHGRRRLCRGRIPFHPVRRLHLR